MEFTVGMLYSAQKFLKYINNIKIKAEEFRKIFYDNFELANSGYMLKFSLDCGWVYVNLEGVFVVTNLGKKIIDGKDYIDRLRIQLMNIIETMKPSWSGVLSYGRSEAKKYFLPSIYQCFDEANLFDSYDQDVIDWWDYLASISRGITDDTKLKIGRLGERLSYEYELERTGKAPIWKSIDSNFAGYDLLSYIDSNSNEKLKIEVKTTINKNKMIFYITRNEWNVAENSDNYIIHFWLLETDHKLKILSKDNIKCHIPNDCGNGEWQNVKIILNKN